ncbi:winged helix-turn-helix domain-containing protein [Micromonospora sp. PLK6-60]|nr:winged helix-turn-helix domain-containing protein [Micromonospora sp. PLK6-60]
MNGRSRTLRQQLVTKGCLDVSTSDNYRHGQADDGQISPAQLRGWHLLTDQDDPGPAGDEPRPLVIAVTASPAERIALAERLAGVAPLLLVADLAELRRLIASGPHPTDPPPSPDRADGREPAGRLLIDSRRRTARHGDREADLTRLEHALLSCLATEPVRVWSYAELHRSVWRAEGPRHRADVQSLVKRLRRKLHGLGTGVTIDAERGVGFRLTEHGPPRVGDG